MNRTFYIAGVQFRPAEEVRKAVSLMKEGNHLGMVPDPTNKYDPNAIKIEYNIETADGVESLFLGFVPKKFSAEVAGLLEAGIELACIVEAVNPSAKPWEMCKVTIKEAEE